MSWLRVVLLTVSAAVLQVSFVGALRIGGIVPNIVLVLLVCLVVWGTASEALLAAVVAGIIMDVSGSGLFGLATSSLVAISLSLVALRQLGLDGHNWLARLALVAAASFVWWLIHIAALGLHNFTLVASWQILIGEIFINCLIALVFTERLVHGARTV